MDDMIDSLPKSVNPEELTKNIDKILDSGGFKVKECLISGDQNKQKLSGINGLQEHEDSTYKAAEVDKIGDILSSSLQVLGFWWNPLNDSFEYKIRLNFCPKKRK